MAEEDTKTPPAEAAAPAEQKADSNGKRGGKGARDETPIEELFDLSKPIPRVSLAMTSVPT